MHLFDIQSVDWYHAFIFGLSSNLFCLLYNIPTVVSIMHMGNSWKWRIGAQLVMIYLHIVTKLLFDIGEWWNILLLGEDIITVIVWFIVHTIVLFNSNFCCDLLGVLIYTIFSIKLFLCLKKGAYSPPIKFNGCLIRPLGFSRN